MANRRATADGRTTSARGARKRRTGLIWSLALGAIVVLLMLTEQVALLYVLATLGVSALLIVVAFASFGEARSATEPAPLDDSAAISDRSPAARGARVSAS